MKKNCFSPKDSGVSLRHTASHWYNVYSGVLDTIKNIPLYQHYKIDILREDNINETSLPQWLAEFPVLSKKDVRTNFPKNLLKKDSELSDLLRKKQIEIVTTSGSTSEVLQVILDSGWWDKQLFDAMRLNAHAKKIIDTNEYRMAVLTTPICSNTDCHVSPTYSLMENRTINGVLYLNKGSDPSSWNDTEYERIVTEWNGFKPTWVEADPAYLALVCEYAARTKQHMHQPEFLILTYELLKHAYRKIIRSVFNVPMYQMYGATEVGILFMECEHGYFHHNSQHSHIELIQITNDLFKPIVTTLGREWMPLIRYELNDYVQIVPASCCPCGLNTDGYLLKSIEGRIPESIHVEEHIITPAMLDKMIFDLDNEIKNWQLIMQDSSSMGHRAHLKLRGMSSEPIKRVLEQVLQTDVMTTSVNSIKPEMSGKFKAIGYE